jgi:hypothetical protein
MNLFEACIIVFTLGGAACGAWRGFAEGPLPGLIGLMVGGGLGFVAAPLLALVLMLVLHAASGAPWGTRAEWLALLRRRGGPPSAP